MQLAWAHEDARDWALTHFAATSEAAQHAWCNMHMSDYCKKSGPLDLIAIAVITVTAIQSQRT